MSTAPARYLFGDSEVAGQRLRVLAEAFAPATRRFVREAGLARPRLAVDLGCGPGYSTHLLAEALGCDRVVGLDISRRFIARAGRTATDRVSFRRHDVTSVPFPVEASDVVYCRFLLTHLPRPETAVRRWASQLRPNGCLLLEEIEWIHTTNAVFATYNEILRAMLDHQSTQLCVGPTLDGLGDSELLRRRGSRLERRRLQNRAAATLFGMNLQAWKDHPFVRRNWCASTIGRLAEELDALATTPSEAADIEWGLRQLMFRRA